LIKIKIQRNKTVLRHMSTHNTESMPSRKKARGQARKARQKIRDCIHHTAPNGCTIADTRLCFGLMGSFVSRIDSHFIERPLFRGLIHISSNNKDFFEDIVRFYDNEYTKLNDIQKDLFRSMVAASGAYGCLANAKDEDLNHVIGIAILLKHIEVMDRFGGELSSGVSREMLNAIADLYQCPRETVKFFHHRIPCDCLKELYHHLKETTKRTTLCFNCRKLGDRKEIYECSDCKAAVYCSRECAKAHYAEHKELCEICQP
jgi:hypothetical protein